MRASSTACSPPEYARTVEFSSSIVTGSAEQFGQRTGNGEEVVVAQVHGWEPTERWTDFGFSTPRQDLDGRI